MDEQLIPAKFGHSGVTSRHAHSILTKPSGFINYYDYSLNPYSGCAFGCSYCYAAFFARSETDQANWGQWIEVKANALELLRKKRKKPLTDKMIYMSSVTDPYQPVERALKLTRAILQELADYHQPRLVVQTRGALVTRDIDLLRQFRYVQVNMTVTTDDEAIRRAFEPFCPSTEKRLQAITEVAAAGVQTAITLTPLLPVKAPEAFAQRLRATGVNRFVVQHFHAGKVRFAAGTRAEAQQLAQAMRWDAATYAAVVAVLRDNLPSVGEGKAGFIPVWHTPRG